jgi:hypothetical protein
MSSVTAILRLVAAAGACTVLASAASARNCQFTDHYALRTDAAGEAEIVEMYSAFAAAPTDPVCEFIVGDRVVIVAVINDWPGGQLTQNASLFYCVSGVERCHVERLDYGDLQPGDYMIAIEGVVPGYFGRPVCKLDWDTEIFNDGSFWDEGGRGELAPGPDPGPETECECMYFHRFPTDAVE